MQPNLKRIKQLWPTGEKELDYKEAEAITKAASSRGSQMHSYLESFLLGRENLSFFEDNEQYKKMAKEIIDKGLTNRLEEIYGVECTMHYPEDMQAQQTVLVFMREKKQ